MKIDKVEAYAIRKKPADAKPYWGSRAWGSQERPRQREISSEYPTPYRRRYVYSGTIDTVVVKLTTSDGLVGFGEAKAPVAPGVAKAIIDELLAPIVLGEDPRDHLLIWERMYAGMRVRGHRAGFYTEAISGIDIALWDLAGKIAGVPIYRLLGGCFRNPVRVYASGIPALPAEADDQSWEELTAEAESIRARGYTGVKMALGRGLAGDLRSVRLVRERLGDDFIIYTDAAGVYDRAQALQLGRELEALKVGWLEMPTFPEDVDGYVQLATALDIPIALDSLTSRFEARELIRLGGIDVVQPDVCRAGGITECRRIAELADNFGLAFAPHVSIGSAIHFAATAHLASAMPNTITSEYWIGDNPLGDRILEQPLRLENGYLETPSGPGLGIVIREDVLTN
jgi:D-arabinonate dehydratase/D-galactarolactone cycloisomerase